MTAQHVAGEPAFYDVSVQRLLEGLARVHRWILAIDSRQRVVWASRPCAELLGFEGVHPGADARSFFPSLPQPDQVWPLQASARKQRRPTRASLERPKLDGRRIPVDLDLVRVGSPGGELTVVIVRPRPATERERASGASGKRRSDLDAHLLDAAPDAVLVVDCDGFVRRANPAAEGLLGLAAEQILGCAVSTLLTDCAEDVEALAMALEGPGESSRCELRLRGANGVRHTVAVRIAHLADETRALFLRDVTDERHGELELRKANDELEHCVNALAHDLRSPLVALLGFSRLLRQDYEAALDETGRHYLDRIEQAARTMEALIHDLLELARIGELGERSSLVDPRKVLLQISAEFKYRLDEAGIQLRLPDACTPLVYCDHSRLYQVFSNLIGNAIDHMGPCADPRVEVRIEETERTHEIIVTDNGRGVPAQHQERIFEVFQSLGTRAGGRRGTGMGLAIVKKIAEKHGGRVWLESESGKGCRFHVSLPSH